jgi:hypothetical protein
LVATRGAIPGAAQRVWTQAQAATRAADALLAGDARSADVIPVATEVRVGEPRGVPVADAIRVSSLEAWVGSQDARPACAGRLRDAWVAAEPFPTRVRVAIQGAAAEQAGIRARVLTLELGGPAADANLELVRVAARRREQKPDGQPPDEPPALGDNPLPAEPELIVHRSPAGFRLRFAGGRDSD